MMMASKLERLIVAGHSINVAYHPILKSHGLMSRLQLHKLVTEGSMQQQLFQYKHAYECVSN
jgi:hypothetical protein